LSDDILGEKYLRIQGVAYHEDPTEQLDIITKLITNMKANAVFSRGFSEIKLGGMSSVEVEGVSAKSFTITCLRGR
jgi:hypothetical protein